MDKRLLSISSKPFDYNFPEIRRNFKLNNSSNKILKLKKSFLTINKDLNLSSSFSSLSIIGLNENIKSSKLIHKKNNTQVSEVYSHQKSAFKKKIRLPVLESKKGHQEAYNLTGWEII